MNINFNDPIVWVVLVSGLLILVLLVIVTRKFVAYSRKHRNLKREIRTKKLLAEENNKTIEKLFVLRRVLTLGLDNLASKKAKKVKSGERRVQKICFILFYAVSPKVANTPRFRYREKQYGKKGFPCLAFEEKADRFLWKIVVRPWMVFWNDLVPRIFSKPPWGRNIALTVLSGYFDRLFKKQEIVISDLEELITPHEESHVTPDNAVERMAKGREKAKEKEKSDKELAERLKKAKATLSNAIKYITVRQDRKSLEIGEGPVTAGARCLDFAEAAKECKVIEAKVKAMEKEGLDPNEIIDFILEVTPLIESGYEADAKKIAKVEFSLDKLKGMLNHLGKDMGKPPSTPILLENAQSILEIEVPILWGIQQHVALNLRLIEITKSLEQVLVEVETLSFWSRKVASLRKVISEIQDGETTLKEDYQIEVERNKTFDKHLALFNDKTKELWANNDFEGLNKLIETVSPTFTVHHVKVVEKSKEVGLVVQSLGISTLSESEVAALKMAEIAQAGNSGGPRPKNFGPPMKPELSGSSVKVISPHGIGLDIDSSLVPKYLEDGYKVVEKER